jgi:hypothetical protein
MVAGVSEQIPWRVELHVAIVLEDVQAVERSTELNVVAGVRGDQALVVREIGLPADELRQWPCGASENRCRPARKMRLPRKLDPSGLRTKRESPVDCIQYVYVVSGSERCPAP